jgi:hypothetical protein
VENGPLSAVRSVGLWLVDLLFKAVRDHPDDPEMELLAQTTGSDGGAVIVGLMVWCGLAAIVGAIAD